MILGKDSINGYWCLFWAMVMILLNSSCKKVGKDGVVAVEGILGQVEASLGSLAKVWYPITVDSVNGGFWTDFDYRWNRVGKQDKMLVSQARHVWSASVLAEYYHDAYYQKIAKHGFEFLRDHMWDYKNGGFHTLIGPSGDSLQVLSNGKSAYGNSFAIYGLATYFKVSKDSAALNLAKKTFYWLEEKAHDPLYDGYFDVLKLDGSWMLDQVQNDAGYDNFIRKDWKDQNSSIHLLESFTALYHVWPDPLLRQRLEELFLIIRDTITTEKGYLTLHLGRDWTPITLKDSSETYRKKYFYLDHVSFGHDVETAFLLLEASHALGIANDSLTLIKTKKMVDHALEWGWDDEKGGFFEGGYYGLSGKEKTIIDDQKVWWTQAEGLNTLLLMSKLYPEEKRYGQMFKQQWHYINTYLIDHAHGGWYDVGFDTDPEAKNRAKAHQWKVNYHNVRALVQVAQMLKG